MLKDFTGDQMAEALCLIAEPIEHITQDEEVMEAIKKVAEERKKGGVIGKLAGLTYGRFVPLLLRKHKHDTFVILSVLSGKSVEELANENALVLFKSIKDALTPDIVHFFTLSVDTDVTE